ncbi:hypothetical protein POVWA1_047150 [Plasmodium ovale wallikeri]|uniref:Uncharacterized protein n=1 Tax=Plasmodium ovale wallikeri TaxID=864142 RepID=A0A1A8ZGT7_PLAOA|nr:hypothetical protein POVWA1_047150 [Plasmodium ovale wallikeri]
MHAMIIFKISAELGKTRFMKIFPPQNGEKKSEKTEQKKKKKKKKKSIKMVKQKQIIKNDENTKVVNTQKFPYLRTRKWQKTRIFTKILYTCPCVNCPTCSSIMTFADNDPLSAWNNELFNVMGIDVWYPFRGLSVP